MSERRGSARLVRAAHRHSCAVACSLATLPRRLPRRSVPTDDRRFLAASSPMAFWSCVLLVWWFAELRRLYAPGGGARRGAAACPDRHGVFSVISPRRRRSLIAIVGSVTLERAASIRPSCRTCKASSTTPPQAARLFRRAQCRSLLQEAQLTAFDLDRARALFITDRDDFHEILRLARELPRFFGRRAGQVRRRDRRRASTSPQDASAHRHRAATVEFRQTRARTNRSA